MCVRGAGELTFKRSHTKSSVHLLIITARIIICKKKKEHQLLLFFFLPYWKHTYIHNIFIYFFLYTHKNVGKCYHYNEICRPLTPSTFKQISPPCTHTPPHWNSDIWMSLSVILVIMFCWFSHHVLLVLSFLDITAVTKHGPDRTVNEPQNHQKMMTKITYRHLYVIFFSRVGYVYPLCTDLPLKNTTHYPNIIWKIQYIYVCFFLQFKRLFFNMFLIKRKYEFGRSEN